MRLSLDKRWRYVRFGRRTRRSAKGDDFRDVRNSMPRARLLSAWIHFHAERERALLARLHRADADQPPRDFLAAFVADHQHHRVFPGAAVGWIAEAAFHFQRRQRRSRRQLTGWPAIAQLVVAGGAYRGAFQDRLAAMRTRARRAGRARTGGGHCFWPLPLFLWMSVTPALSSSQPNSAWPRIFEPLATLKVRDFTSPVSAPVCSSSTCCAFSMLPVSSPATVTRSARTLPLTLAPFSMVRSPRTLMSPLKRPAMRTCPAPSILPSMTRSGEMCDSAAERTGAGAALLETGLTGTGASAGSGTSNRARSGGSCNVDDGDLTGSFHRAMAALRFGSGEAERTPNRAGWEPQHERKVLPARGIVRCFSGST